MSDELRREEYLGYGDSAVRRIFTKVRTGTVELRLETGRWESLLVAGKLLMLPRQYRTCRLCEEEVEDLRHWLFVCPAYSTERQAFMRVCSGVLAERLGQGAKSGGGDFAGREGSREASRDRSVEVDVVGECQHGGTCVEFARNMWVKREPT